MRFDLNLCKSLVLDQPLDSSLHDDVNSSNMSLLSLENKLNVVKNLLKCSALIIIIIIFLKRKKLAIFSWGCRNNFMRILKRTAFSNNYIGVGQIGHVLAAFCSKVWPHCGSTSSVSAGLREIDRRSTGITISDSVPEFSNFGPDNASFILFYSNYHYQLHLI